MIQPGYRIDNSFAAWMFCCCFCFLIFRNALRINFMNHKETESHSLAFKMKLPGWVTKPILQCWLWTTILFPRTYYLKRTSFYIVSLCERTLKSFIKFHGQMLVSNLDETKWLHPGFYNKFYRNWRWFEFFPPSYHCLEFAVWGPKWLCWELSGTTMGRVKNSRTSHGR